MKFDCDRAARVVLAPVLLLVGGVMTACDGPHATTKAPADIIARMLESLTEVRTAHFEIEASFANEPREAGAQSLAYPLSPNVDGVYQYLPAEVSARIQMHGQIQSDVSKSNDGSFHLTGHLAFGGLAFTFAADLVKQAESYFARIVEAPSLGFFDLATLKGKWIRLAAEDAHAGMIISEQSAMLLRQYQLLFRILKEENLIRVIKEFPEEKAEGGALYHYEITLEREKFGKFYRRLMEETKKEFGEEAPVKFNEETLAYLEGPEFAQFYETLQKNVGLELWVDAQSFYPRKISYALRLVPPDELTKLQDKQFRFTLAVGIKDINVPVVVEVPSSSISVDEARALVTGKTVPEVRYKRQGEQIERIRNALRQYRDRTGKRPTTLSELVTSVRPVSGPAKEQSPFLPVVPRDVFTGQDYIYESDGKGYRLVYQMKLPPQRTNVDTEFVEGTNTATERALSEEAERQ